MLHSNKTITISPPMAKPISSLVNITEYLSKKHEVISSETIVAIPEIFQVTFPVQSNPKSSWFKIEPPRTSLVTTACKLKPLRSKGTNPETKGTLSTTAELKSWRNASSLRLTSSRCNKEKRLKTHLGHVTVSLTPPSFESEQFPTIDFF